MPTRQFSGVGFADDDELREPEEALLASIEYEVELVRAIPSVLERVRSLGDSPEGADAAEIIAFCLHHGVNSDETATLTAPGSHEVRAQRGAWQNILLNLRNYEEGDPEPEQRGRIPIAEIHVPDVAGCEGKYKQESGTSKRVGLNVKIRGVGGGGGQEAKVTLSNEVSSTRCGQVTIPGTWQVTPWFNPDANSRIDLVTFRDFKPESIGVRGIPAERQHLCARGVVDRLDVLLATPDAVFELHPVELAGSSITPSQQVEETRELTLTVDDVLEVTSQFIRGFSYEWKIVGAASYLRFFEDARSHVHFWCWDTAT